MLLLKMQQTLFKTAIQSSAFSFFHGVLVSYCIVMAWQMCLGHYHARVLPFTFVLSSLHEIPPKYSSPAELDLLPVCQLPFFIEHDAWNGPVWLHVLVIHYLLRDAASLTDTYSWEKSHTSVCVNICFLFFTKDVRMCEHITAFFIYLLVATCFISCLGCL